MVADSIMCIPLTPATAPPPKALKNVIPLVMPASIRAFPQSNFRSTAFVSSFVQQTKKPLIVRVGILRVIPFRHFWNLPFRVNVGFVRGLYLLLEVLSEHYPEALWLFSIPRQSISDSVRVFVRLIS